MNDDKKHEAKIKRLQGKIDDLKDDLLVANAEIHKQNTFCIMKKNGEETFKN